MKAILTSILSIAFFLQINAQTFDDLSFGTDNTFDVVSWNIEWFPKNGTTTVNYVSEIIEQLDADVLTIQEIEDTTAFRQMINGMTGYDVNFESSYYGGLTMVYKTENVVINSMYEIYTTYPYWKPFPRSPKVMELTFKGDEYIVINNHFKCCGDGTLVMYDEDDEEYRRYSASSLLKEYVENNFNNDKVIITGDLNDVLTDNESDNVFQMILDDPDNFSFADMAIAEGSSSNWSYPDWPSHLDHILITNELFDDFAHNDSEIQTIRLDDYMSGGWSSYDYNISDHRPVGIKIYHSASNIFSQNSETNILQIHPNPFNESTQFRFTDHKKNKCLNIYTLSGQLIEQIAIPPGIVSVQWNANNLSEGIYIVEMLSENMVSEISKMVLIR